MSLLDGILPGIVNDLLDPEFLGKTSTIYFSKEGVYNPTTGEYDATEEISGTLRTSPPIEFNKYYIDGTTILNGDLQMIIPKESWDLLDSDFGSQPTTKMSILVESTKFSIIKANPIYVGVLIAAFDLQLRGI